MSIAIRVRERLLKYKSDGARCVIGVMKMPSNQEQLSGLILSILESANYIIRDLNCSFIEGGQVHTKIASGNETYDGYVGMIHRNEADFAIGGVRADLLPGEPGKLTPPFASGDLIIVTSKYPPQELHLDLTKFLDLGTSFYIFGFMMMLFLLPIVYVYAETQCTGKENHNLATVLLKKYVKCCENMIHLILDQEQFKATTFTGHMLALTASIFTLALVHGFLLNSVSADLVIIRAPPPIDSIDELLASNATPLVFDNLFAYNLYKSSPVGSKNHLVWQRIQERSPHSIIVIEDGNLVKSMHTILKPLWLHESVYIDVETTATALDYISCIFDFSNELGKSSTGVYLAREHLSAGMMTMLMSHRIHHYTERVLTTGLRAVFEAGLYDGFISLIRFILPESQPQFGIKITSQTLQCFEGQGEEQQVPETLDLPHMKRLFRSWFYLLCLATAVLVIEVLGRPKRTRKRTNISWVKPVIID